MSIEKTNQLEETRILIEGFLNRPKESFPSKRIKTLSGQTATDSVVSILSVINSVGLIDLIGIYSRYDRYKFGKYQNQNGQVWTLDVKNGVGLLTMMQNEMQEKMGEDVEVIEAHGCPDIELVFVIKDNVLMLKQES